VEAVADAIHRACTMDPQEKARRLTLLQDRIRARDVHRWVEDFLEAAHEAPRGRAERAAAESAPVLELDVARRGLPSLRRLPRLIRGADAPPSLGGGSRPASA
jgi:hypothetical protein